MSNGTKADFVEPWECEVCAYTGEPTMLSDSKEEWGREVEIECPKCLSEYINGSLIFRGEGDRCSFCGEWTEEPIEINLGGSKSDIVCKSCEEEYWK